MFFKGPSKLMRLLKEQEWDEALFHLAQNPNEAMRWDTVPIHPHSTFEIKCLPIHEACALGPPTLAIVEELVRAFPGSLSLVDDHFGRTPLHTACSKGASSEIIHYLLEQYPAAASLQDILGRTPLHYAICDHAPYETVVELVERCPLAARLQDNNGWLPLHVACRYGATHEIFKLLVDAYPPGLDVKTKSCGMTPLMCANRFKVCMEQSSLDLLRLHDIPAQNSPLDQKNITAT